VPFGTVFPAPGTTFQNTMVYATQVLRADTAATTNAGGAGGLSPAALGLLVSSVGIAALGLSRVLQPKRALD
jgi:hypothetical protein